jgi:hypothetical protein
MEPPVMILMLVPLETIVLLELVLEAHSLNVQLLINAMMLVCATLKLEIAQIQQ